MKPDVFFDELDYEMHCMCLEPIIVTMSDEPAENYTIHLMDSHRSRGIDWIISKDAVDIINKEWLKNLAKSIVKRFEEEI